MPGTQHGPMPLAASAESRELRPLNNLLVYSPSPTGSAAVRLSNLLAAATGCGVTLADAVEEIPSDMRRHLPHGWDVRELVREKKSMVLDQIAGRMRRMGLRPRVAVHDGESMEVLRDIVRREEHDLLIVDAVLHETSPPRRALIRSLIEDFPCPVLFARPLKRRRRLRVVVPISASALEAAHPCGLYPLQIAGWLATVNGGEVHALHAWQSVSEGTMRWAGIPDHRLEEYQQAAEAEAREQLTLIFEGCGDTSGPVEFHLVPGDARNVIPRFAQEQRANVVIMGSSGRKGLSRHLFGNVADAVFDEISCSMLVVHAA